MDFIIQNTETVMKLKCTLFDYMLLLYEFLCHLEMCTIIWPGRNPGMCCFVSGC